MKAPLSWLAEYVKLGKEHTVEKIQSAFIQRGFEVEDIQFIGKGLAGPIVVGEIVSIENLTDYKKPIRYCQVNIGKGVDSLVGIVCGATNFVEGDKVVVALPGSVLPENFNISARETYGKISEGMICSIKELGIGDEQSGILVLDDSYQVGVNAISELQLIDTVFDLAVLPDRGYALSIRGLARELASHFSCEFIDPTTKTVQTFKNDSKQLGKIEAKDVCRSLVLTKISGFNPERDTPWEMKRKLLLTGLRSISLPVDITNFIMIEIGQPLHAFDANKVQGKICIRYGNADEELETIDHTNRKLSDKDLVVADERGVLSLAGLMGGISSEIDSNTTDIILEAAHFEAQKISESARRHVLSSEASKRFERGVDTEIAAFASNYAVSLFERFSTVESVSRWQEINPTAKKNVLLDKDLLNTIVGFEIIENDVQEMLNQLGCLVIDKDPIKVEIPSWRFDLANTNDLAEELLRVLGYDKIPLVNPPSSIGSGLTPSQQSLNQLKTFLAAKGAAEILSYPFVSHSQSFRFVDIEESDLVKIANPLSEEEPYLRVSLLPGLLAVAIRNLGRGNESLNLFETGSVYRKISDEKIPKVTFPLNGEQLKQADAILPRQPKLLSGLLTGRKADNPLLGKNGVWTWSDAIELVAELLNLFNLDFDVTSDSSKGFHPGRTAKFYSGEKFLGIAGELHPELLDEFTLQDRVSCYEIDLSTVFALADQTVIAQPISNYPIAKEDLAVVVQQELPIWKIHKSLQELSISNLEKFQIFDVYTGAPVPDGKKSIAISLQFRSHDRTLTAEDVSGWKSEILATLAKQYGAELRT